MTLLSVDPAEPFPPAVRHARTNEPDPALVVFAVARIGEGISYIEYPQLSHAVDLLAVLRADPLVYPDLTSMAVAVRRRDEGLVRTWVLAEWNRDATPRLVVHPCSPSVLWALADPPAPREQPSPKPEYPFSRPSPRYGAQ